MYLERNDVSGLHEDIEKGEVVKIRRKPRHKSILQAREKTLHSFGSKKVRRVMAKRHAEEAERRALVDIERSKFHEVLDRVDDDNFPKKDLRFLFANGKRFIGELQDEEFNERFLRIWKREYTNLDVVMVSAHFSSVGNNLASRSIATMVHKSGVPRVGFQPIPAGAQDAVDLAIEAQNSSQS